MKRLSILLLCLLCFVGCQGKEEAILNQHVNISFFYVKGCSQCNAFKKHALSKLEKTFNDEVTIYQYDLDDPNSKDIYDEVIDRIDHFDNEYYGNGPFIVVDDYFALLGYNVGDEDYLIDDIIRATKGKELGYELEGYRFLFK